MEVGRRVGVLAGVACSVLVLAACGSSGGAASSGSTQVPGTSASQSSSATGSSSPSQGSGAATGHAFGTSADIAYDDYSGAPPGRLSLTVDVTKGALADVAKVDWGSSPPASPTGWTPYYLKVTAKNIGTRGVVGGGLAGMTNALDGSGMPLKQHTLLTGFPTCQVDSSDTLKVGATTSACVIYEVPDSTTVAKVNVLSGPDIVQWG